jgi:NAD+ synthase (glutamine-hydrolysing)
VVDAAVRLFAAIPILGERFEPRFQTQGGSRSESLALQNLQARLRMTLSYYYAQLVSAVRGGSSSSGSSGPLLVIATGNCDEGLSGYFTKYDCSSGDLSPIGSICKNDLRKFVKHVIDSGLCTEERSAPGVSVLEE